MEGRHLDEATRSRIIGLYGSTFADKSDILGEIDILRLSKQLDVRP
jgi:hypothetical protein